MSGRGGLIAPSHQRARDLAAARIDEVLPPVDEAWLTDHLEMCRSCAAIAKEHSAIHDRLGALRQAAPQPPRDLWARTSSAIEAERSRAAGVGRWRRLRGSPRRSPSLALAPVVAMVAVMVVIGAGLLNGRPTVPGGTAAAATPIAIKGAADLQVLALDSAGNLQLLSRRVDEVCPTGVKDCGVSPTFAVTGVTSFGTAADLVGAMSPSGGQMVVVRRDPGSQSVYVVPVKLAASPAATRSTVQASIAATQEPSSHLVSASPSQSAPSSASASPSAPASPASAPASPASASPASPAAGSASPSTSPDASPDASPTTTESPGPSDSTPEASPSETIEPSPSDVSATASPSDATVSPSPSAQPTSAPSVEVTPAPDAAIKIASGVTVLGAPTYSPDGSHLAFSAMPSDASTGPDIYVWAVGDRSAKAVTTDHDSWLAGWTATGILVSSVDDGMPTTYRLDPATGHATQIGAPGTWLPAVSPTGAIAAWWAGTVKLAADGVTWAPDQGRLVLGTWPSTGAAAAASQVLAKGPLDAWQVRWDNTGAVVAVWVGQNHGRSGRLSLYSVDDATGAPDLSTPMLDGAHANPDFSLRAGRLAWTAPAGDAPQTVDVLAWSGKTVYPRIELPADGSGTVVP